MIQRLNFVRRENPALQRLDNIGFLDAANDAIIAYAKREGPNAIICVVTWTPITPRKVSQVPMSWAPRPRSCRGPARRRAYHWRVGQLRARPGRAPGTSRVNTT
jgi:starch synthase (maltosyl-transferring)